MKEGYQTGDVRVTESSKMTLLFLAREKKAKQMQRKPVSHSPLIGLRWRPDSRVAPLKGRRRNCGDTPDMTDDMLDNHRKP